MVSYLLYGGSRLGNVLHQISATYAYARKHDLDYVIPRDNYGYHKVFAKVNYGEIDATKFKLYKEPSHAYNAIPSPAEFGTDNILLEGYFQCFKYCEEYRDEILSRFGFEYAINKGVTSIHVRRGDYVKYQNSFPLCTVNYYKKAIKAFTDNGFTDFLVFGEDAETYNWCRENFKDIKANIMYHPIGTPFGDMQRMSCCENQIISNSTFSVWAAWANRNPNKMVVAPCKLNNWYGKLNPCNTKDVYPDDWVGIRF